MLTSRIALIFYFLLCINATANQQNSTASLPNIKTETSSWWFSAGSSYSLQKSLIGESSYEGDKAGLSLQIERHMPYYSSLAWSLKASFDQTSGNKNGAQQELVRAGAGMYFPLWPGQHHIYVKPAVEIGNTSFESSDEEFSESSLFFSTSIGYLFPEVYGLKIRFERQISRGLNQGLSGSRFEQTLLSIKL